MQTIIIMQAVIMTTTLIALIPFTIKQHLALKATQAKTKRQDTINSAFAAEINRLKADAKPRQPVKLPELPPFIKQPQTRYFMEVEHNAN